MMAVLLPHQHAMHPRPPKRRRTATAVMAGYFDYTPQRDVLTSLLNGVGPNKEVEGEEEAKRLKKKKDKKDKRSDSSTRRDSLADIPSSDATQVASTSSIAPSLSAQSQSKKKKSFWSAHPQRPNIQIMTMERSVSVTPPPGYSPVNVPSASPTPSISSSTSRTSSKRPRTPEDHEDIVLDGSTPPPAPEPKPRKKRKAHKKGWKGWVEGSPKPSGKLINLDSAPVLQDRRLRSGKNFDAIGVGKDGWV